jgi:hypothetical protein
LHATSLRATSKCDLVSGTLTFLLAGRKNLTADEMAGAFLSVATAIMNAISRQRPPAVFKVYATEKRVQICLKP